MKFEEIFNQAGLYKSEGFKKGVCFVVENATLFIRRYKDENDLSPITEILAVYKELFSKEYTKVFTKKELFKSNCVQCGTQFCSHGDTCNKCATTMDGEKRDNDGIYTL
jgi:hypothetical protein